MAHTFGPSNDVHVFIYTGSLVTAENTFHWKSELSHIFTNSGINAFSPFKKLPLPDKIELSHVRNIEVPQFRKTSACSYQIARITRSNRIVLCKDFLTLYSIDTHFDASILDTF